MAGTGRNEETWSDSICISTARDSDVPSTRRGQDGSLATSLGTTRDDRQIGIQESSDQSIAAKQFRNAYLNLSSGGGSWCRSYLVRSSGVATWMKPGCDDDVASECFALGFRVMFFRLLAP